MFGTQFVGAIHGRLLTAWSTAGILGPMVVNYLHDTRKEAQIPFDQIYGPIFYVLAGMLVIGFVADLLVRPVSAKWAMSEQELAAERKLAHDAALANAAGGNATAQSPGESKPGLVFGFWLLVGAPLAWGVWNTLAKTLALFK